MMPDLSIVVPVFNEADRDMASRLDEVASFLEDFGKGFEIILVDDGSTDSTPDIAGAWISRDARRSLIRLPENRGKGAAVKAGLTESKGTTVLFMDADLATPLDQVGLLTDRLRAGCDVAIGSRGMRASRLEKREGIVRESCGKLFNRLIQILLLPGIFDTQCGFKAFSGNAARALAGALSESRFGFDVELLYLARASGMRVDEIPVRWRHQPGSHVRFIRDGASMIMALLRVAYRARVGGYRTIIKRLREALREPRPIPEADCGESVEP